MLIQDIPNLIVSMFAGSRLYGTATLESDVDIRGIRFSPVDALIGLRPFEQQESNSGEEDIVIYSMEKFCRLCLECNPSLIELLFVPPGAILHATETWYNLQMMRGAFLSAKARTTFVGYAYSQYLKIERHHKWLTSPPDHEPTVQEFNGVPSETGVVWPDNSMQNAYKNAHSHWKQYINWRTNRNPERAVLEQEHLFDTKHGLHLMRLLEEGRELLTTGFITLPRPNAKELLGIRNGSMTYEQLLARFETERKDLETLLTTLPEKPDFNAVNKFVIQSNFKHLQETYHAR